MRPHQHVNHFPASHQLTRKTDLAQNIKAAISRLGPEEGRSAYAFVPRTLVLPEDQEEIALFPAASDECGDDTLWIYKPSSGACGRGIEILRHPAEVMEDERGAKRAVLQEYIRNPLLVEGRKFDLRLYVAVTSFAPVRAYLYGNGLARFANLPYDAGFDSLSSPAVHLTNVSLNKQHPEFVKNTSAARDDEGSVWSLDAIRTRLESLGHDSASIFQHIDRLIVASLAAVEPVIAPELVSFQPSPCFELFGFDVILDAELKPWLLEVNSFPSVRCGTPLDLDIKSNLLADLFTLVGFVPPSFSPAPGAGESAAAGEEAAVGEAAAGDWYVEEARNELERAGLGGFRCLYPVERRVRDAFGYDRLFDTAVVGWSDLMLDTLFPPTSPPPPSPPSPPSPPPPSPAPSPPPPRREPPRRARRTRAPGEPNKGITLVEARVVFARYLQVLHDRIKQGVEVTQEDLDAVRAFLALSGKAVSASDSTAHLLTHLQTYIDAHVSSTPVDSVDDVVGEDLRSVVESGSESELEHVMRSIHRVIPTPDLVTITPM